MSVLLSPVESSAGIAGCYFVLCGRLVWYMYEGIRTCLYITPPVQLFEAWSVFVKTSCDQDSSKFRTICLKYQLLYRTCWNCPYGDIKGVEVCTIFPMLLNGSGCKDLAYCSISTHYHHTENGYQVGNIESYYWNFPYLKLDLYDKNNLKIYSR